MKWLMKEGRARWRTLMSVYIVAVLLNYLWELAQASLYVGQDRYNAAVFWHCFVASLGDGVMVLLIVGVGWITLRQLKWFEHPILSGYLLMLTTGLLLALSVEWVGVHLLGRWQYTARMPLVIGIGVVPIAQMLLLPPLILRIVVALAAKR